MKDQKGEVPRAGDKAIIVGMDYRTGGRPLRNGEIVDVLAGPYYEATAPVLVCDVTPDAFTPHGVKARLLVTQLMRIPPDEEARQLFAEKADSKPIKTKA